MLCIGWMNQESESYEYHLPEQEPESMTVCCCRHPSNCINVFSEKKMVSGKKSRSWRLTVTGFET